jgi:hypothetical protein
MLRKYHIKDAVIAEERATEIALRPKRATPQKLSWPETARAMSAERENWSEWDVAVGDGAGEA